MASSLTHAVVALSLGSTWAEKVRPLRFWILAVFCAELPDVDVIGLWWGVPYGHLLGHRGLTHSIAAAALIGWMIPFIAFREETWRGRRLWLSGVFFTVTLSHGLLDAMTNGGLGVAFFAPFDEQRYFFPIRPLQVSPVEWSSFMAGDWIAIYASEILWIWVPACLWALLTIRRRQQTEQVSRAEVAR
jgi:inner membrane protein